MQCIIDTDCGLTILIHRPFITLDEHYDLPLPFRKQLKQVTELSAENSTLNPPPKERKISGFEKLPLEIQNACMIWWAVSVFTTSASIMFLDVSAGKNQINGLRLTVMETVFISSAVRFERT
jgi:hypothetical protein